MNTATWTDRAPGRERALGHWAWPGAVSFTLLLAIVSGGSSQADSWAFLLFRLLCLGLMGVALLRLATQRRTTVEQLALLLIAAMVALAALQLVPLPFGIFASLPGRDYAAKIFSLANIPPQTMPMTLSPEATRGAILALMPPIAIFLAAMSSEHRVRWMMASVVLIGSVANIFLGLAQRFEGAKSGLYLYEITNYGWATGFFSNRNNFAMLLCVAIPLTWALTQRVIRMRAMRPAAAMAAGGVMMIIILMGLAASESRSGILLGMLALMLSALMVFMTSRESGGSGGRGKRTRMSLLAILGGAFILGEFGMTGILRIVDSDPLSDFRSQMREVTLRAATDYFPVGSGFGTFRAVYGMHETPATMISAYVNHAHNDWLELWLEGGLPAAALMACFLALFLFQTVRVWNPRGAYAEHVLPRAASIVALVLMLHSLVEFPLRMPALACIFAAMLATLVAPPAKRQAQHRSSRRRAVPDEDRDEAPAHTTPVAPAVTAPPVFRVPRADEDTRRREDATGTIERPHRR